MTAKVLGTDRKSIRQRIERIPELYALYGNRAEDAVVPDAPTEAVTLLRTPDQIPAPVGPPDLAQMVQVTEKLMNGGLEKLGVPQKTIEKLRDLNHLKIDAGAWLAKSLQDTHQLYNLQLMTLDARADEIRALYLDTESPRYVKDLDPMARMFWQRAHTEIVDQLGKGYDRMMAGTQAMIAMMRGQNGKNKEEPKKADAGWVQQVPKSIRKGGKK